MTKSFNKQVYNNEVAKEHMFHHEFTRTLDGIENVKKTIRIYFCENMNNNLIGYRIELSTEGQTFDKVENYYYNTSYTPEKLKAQYKKIWEWYSFPYYVALLWYTRLLN